ncbi:hypothetical protein PPYR_12674 [Photinus pyralis]|uniref:DNA-directed RNA polymerase n=1 Tax=Photinus pyralis TaxID=7054 RepID=A0A5N4A6U8_PHOPY|nr:DNA-directed RNA polymerase, mitochondrial [Photinus pyralis]KAB0793054.1 hypothetical protein PPYR_12674 [Photinus pyralis]
MHRFFSVKKTSFVNLPVASFKEHGFNRPICGVCHKLHNIHKGLNYSTKRDTAAEARVRKRAAKKIPSYAEILVVTKGSTSQQKAPVKVLSLRDLKFFTRTNLNLAELYKLKALRKAENVNQHTYHNLTIIDHAPIDDVKAQIELDLKATAASVPLVEEVKQSDSECEPFESLERIPSNPLQPEVLEEVEDHTHTQDAHLVVPPTATEEVISRTLTAYIEVCNYLKSPQRALNALIFHRNHKHNAKKVFPSIKNINVYNGLMRGFAAKGNYEKIEEILSYVAEERIDLNVQSYAAIFECLGRMNADDGHLKRIRSHASEAYRSGISFDRIMNETMFVSDQRDVVLKAIRSHSPNYELKPSLPHLQYSNELVNALNHPDQLRPPSECAARTDGLFTGEDLRERINKQIEIEKHGYVTVKSIEKKETISGETLAYRAAFDDLIKTWEKAALDGFNRDLLSVTARRQVFSLEPYLRVIPSREFVQIIVEEAKKIAQGSETYSPTCQQLYKELGLKVYLRYRVLQKQKTGVLDKIVNVHGKYCEYYANLHGHSDSEVNYYNSRQLWQWIDCLNRSEGASVMIAHRPWTPTVLQNIGKFLYHIIMHDLTINVNVMRLSNKHKNFLPSFYTIFRSQGRLVKEEVKPHPILSRLYRASVPETLTFSPNEVPMMCPPVPWTSVKSGGYLVSPCEVVRLPMQAILQKQRLREAPPSQIYPSLDCLNQLAAVPWKVNGPVLDVVLEVFNSGGSTNLDIPELQPFMAPLTQSPTDKKNVFRQKLQMKRKRAEVYSLWCDCLYRLSLANHFRDDVFWLPHNMDFRGRVYPIPPHLNHLGSDMARSLLVFAEPRPLGPNGFDWLKLHLVNLTGLKKRDSIADRLIFANEVMDKVLDSADNPLTGKMWWAESEEPWQTLACCMEIARAHRSDDPEEYLSHFPVHQDGSCNGLQHYAALGRDQAGAYSVNLSPSRVPQDVYSAVVALVEQQRAKDEAGGNEVAKILKGFIMRKVIKQTIMTTVYGVTRFGARLQIAKQLKDIENFPKEHVWAASSYLTGRTFDSLRSMFTSTREIQDWFTECARLISSVGNENVEWVTPLGLPIVQPYNKYRSFGSRPLYEPFHMDKYEKPNVMKQKNAFPPNFIHSLDSSHMMLTSLWCERKGLVFVSVHDCYWTHASTVAVMNEICRKQFVELHSQNILENLSQFLTERFSYGIGDFSDSASAGDMSKLKLNRALAKLPKTGDFDIKEVLQSVYFFS